MKTVDSDQTFPECSVLAQLMNYKRSQPRSEKPSLQSIAESVWSWMDDNGARSLTFHEDGTVFVRDGESPREFSMEKL